MKKISILACLAACILLTGGCGQSTKNNTTTTSTKKYEEAFTIPAGVNSFWYGYGSVELTGYLQIETKTCNPGDMCSESVEYAWFVLTEKPNNKDFVALLQMDGEEKVAGKQIGLGCYQADANRIWSVNDGSGQTIADVETVENIITGSDLQKLLQSSQSNPVKIKISKPKPALGRGAPDCYSHYRDFAVK